MTKIFFSIFIHFIEYWDFFHFLGKKFRFLKFKLFITLTMWLNDYYNVIKWIKMENFDFRELFKAIFRFRSLENDDLMVNFLIF